MRYGKPLAHHGLSGEPAHREMTLRAGNGTAIRGLVVVACALSGVVCRAEPAPERTVRIAPPEPWVLPPPEGTTTADPANAPLRVIYQDLQVLAGPKGDATYVSLRVRLLRPEALAAGNLVFTWSPDAGPLTLHHLRVTHAGVTTDLTNTARFTVVQREANLEQAMFDGQVTATYQIPGLAVGDEIDYALTTLRRDPTLPEARGNLLSGPQVSLPGAWRLRLSWPADAPVHWQTTRDLGPLTPVAEGPLRSVTVAFRDPTSPDDVAIGAPARYNVRRLLEYSSFADWPALSRRLWPLFDKAAMITPKSSLDLTVATIMAASPDPVVRTETALRLVEDRIRYVFVALDQAALTPADAEVTWARRFGDCKAKSVLLVALLHAMGIEARPVLVNAGGIDGLGDRLPDVALFNHVVVEAFPGGKSTMLDPTRTGDTQIALLPPATWRQGLPLTAAGAAPMTFPTPAPARPDSVDVIDLDMSHGIAAHAPARLRKIWRGPVAQRIRNELEALQPADAQRSLRKLLNATDSWLDATNVSWHADDAHAAIVIEAQGEGDTDWDRSDTMRSFFIPGAGFSPPERLRRPHDQDQTLPWATDWPDWRCWVATVRLPAPDDLHQWGYGSPPIDRELGGIAYWRRAGLTANVMRTVMSKRTMVPEISAKAAAALNEAITDFDNNKSWIQEQSHYRGAARPHDDPPPFTDATDWAAPDAPCSRPATATGGHDNQ